MVEISIVRRGILVFLGFGAKYGFEVNFLGLMGRNDF